MFLKFVSLFLLTFILAFDAKPNGNSTPKEQGIQFPFGIKCLLYRTNAAACADGWVNHGNSCYLIIDIPTLKWSDAQRNCQKLGGDLAKITSADEDKFISDLMFKQKTVTEWGVWIGLQRKAGKQFYWTDGTPLGSYKPFANGEPNNPYSELCGNILGKERRPGKWNDLWCNVNPSYLKRAPVILCQKSSK